mmetsp:Transcript_4035/g.7734  ORF Transcript_4035/g.7734 Transcript_4035/m.7734 type:complete len:230 (+) Transcript_4035:1590-2279(+)
MESLVKRGEEVGARLVIVHGEAEEFPGHHPLGHHFLLELPDRSRRRRPLLLLPPLEVGRPVHTQTQPPLQLHQKVPQLPPLLRRQMLLRPPVEHTPTQKVRHVRPRDGIQGRVEEPPRDETNEVVSLQRNRRRRLDLPLSAPKAQGASLGVEDAFPQNRALGGGEERPASQGALEGTLALHVGQTHVLVEIEHYFDGRPYLQPYGKMEANVRGEHEGRTSVVIPEIDRK